MAGELVSKMPIGEISETTTPEQWAKLQVLLTVWKKVDVLFTTCSNKYMGVSVNDGYMFLGIEPDGYCHS